MTQTDLPEENILFLSAYGTNFRIFEEEIVFYYQWETREVQKYNQVPLGPGLHLGKMFTHLTVSCIIRTTTELSTCKKLSCSLHISCSVHKFECHKSLK